MRQPVVDTLRLSDTLRKVGMEREQAEGVARALGKELGEHVAVQGDLDTGFQGVRSEMVLMRSGLDARIQGVRSELEARIEGVRAEMALMRLRARSQDRWRALRPQGAQCEVQLRLRIVGGLSLGPRRDRVAESQQADHCATGDRQRSTHSTRVCGTGAAPNPRDAHDSRRRPRRARTGSAHPALMGQAPRRSPLRWRPWPGRGRPGNRFRPVSNSCPVPGMHAWSRRGRCRGRACPVPFRIHARTHTRTTTRVAPTSPLPNHPPDAARATTAHSFHGTPISVRAVRRHVLSRDGQPPTPQE